MKRKKPSDRVEHFHHLDDPELADLRRRAQRWTTDNVATLKAAVPELPAGFDNRLGDNWRLMIAIADLAGGEWPDQARQAATAVAEITDAPSVGVKLLADIRDIFASKAVHRIASAELVEALVEIEGRPWANLKGGQPITKNGLALLLAPFGIASGIPSGPLPRRLRTLLVGKRSFRSATTPQCLRHRHFLAVGHRYKGPMKHFDNVR